MFQKAVVLFLSTAIFVSAEVSKVFYINLDTSTSRRTHMEKELVSFSGKIERISAITGEQIPDHKSYLDTQDVNSDIIEKSGGVEEVQATIGCWLSHTKLLERLTTELHTDEHALILEDDVLFPKDWVQKVNNAISTAPRDWDVLKVCGWGSHREKDAVDKDWMLASGPFVFPSYKDPTAKFYYAGSCGYVVSGRSTARVVQHLHSQVITDFDNALLSDASPHPIRTYSMRQHVLESGYGESSTIHMSRRLESGASTAGPSAGPSSTTTTTLPGCEWGEWGLCSAKCDGGEMTRTVTEGGCKPQTWSCNNFPCDLLIPGNMTPPFCSNITWPSSPIRKLAVGQQFPCKGLTHAWPATSMGDCKSLCTSDLGCSAWLWLAQATTTTTTTPAPGSAIIPNDRPLPPAPPAEKSKYGPEDYGCFLSYGVGSSWGWCEWKELQERGAHGGEIIQRGVVRQIKSLKKFSVPNVQGDGLVEVPGIDNLTFAEDHIGNHKSLFARMEMCRAVCYSAWNCRAWDIDHDHKCYVESSEFYQFKGTKEKKWRKYGSVAGQRIQHTCYGPHGEEPPTVGKKALMETGVAAGFLGVFVFVLATQVPYIPRLWRSRDCDGWRRDLIVGVEDIEHSSSERDQLFASRSARSAMTRGTDQDDFDINPGSPRQGEIGQMRDSLLE